MGFSCEKLTKCLAENKKDPLQSGPFPSNSPKTGHCRKPVDLFRPLALGAQMTCLYDQCSERRVAAKATSVLSGNWNWVNAR